MLPLCCRIETLFVIFPEYVVFIEKRLNSEHSNFKMMDGHYRQFECVNKQLVPTNLLNALCV